MCGILAVLSRAAPVDAAAAAAALSSMAARGPDGHGTALRMRGRLLLGSRRLAVIDVDQRSSQPMVDPETGATAVYNGAIYNYLELRSELVAEGARFRTDGDTEVLLAAYRHWGTAAFERFNGMWAVVIHDPVNDRIVVSRDRLGVKPLYLRDDGRALVVASTIRAVLRAAAAAPEVEERAVFGFLAAGHADLEDATFYSGVVPFPAGEVWTMEPDGRTRSRHELSVATGRMAPSDEELRELILDAVRLRLRTGRRAGVLVSSGLDSSIVAWAVARLGGTGAGAGPVAGFYGYGYDPGDVLDETAAAAALVDQLDAATPFRRVTGDPIPDPETLDALLDAQEEPVATLSAVAGLRLYRRMHEHGLAVALTGDGSDELFCGYAGYMLPVLAVDRAFSLHLAEAWRLGTSGHTDARSLAARAACKLPTPVFGRLLRRTRSSVAAISEEFWSLSRERLEDLRAGESGGFGAWRMRGLRQTLLPHVLHYADRNGMASSVEVRSPFLDHRLVSAALALPADRLLGRQGGKLALRRAFRGILPDRIVQGRKQRGLGHAEQFSVGRLAIAELLREPPAQARRFLDLPRLARLLARQPEDPRLWWPVCLLLWLRRLETRGA